MLVGPRILLRLNTLGFESRNTGTQAKWLVGLKNFFEAKHSWFGSRNTITLAEVLVG